MKKIAIIPARGGSKRIPRKNIKDFLGKPLIAYSIDAAIKSGLFDFVMVSTDDEEIAKISEEYGAQVPFFRSAANSDDHATTASVLIEVLQSLKVSYDVVCCIYPTAPFITPKLLVDSYNLFTTSGADSLIPVVKYSYPPQRSFIQRNGLLKYREKKYLNTRSQDLEPIYHDAGQFYWTMPKTLEVYHSIKGNRTIPYELSEHEVQDIDNNSDFKIAVQKYKYHSHAK